MPAVDTAGAFRDADADELSKAALQAGMRGQRGCERGQDLLALLNRGARELAGRHDQAVYTGSAVDPHEVLSNPVDSERVLPPLGFKPDMVGSQVRQPRRSAHRSVRFRSTG